MYLSANYQLPGTFSPFRNFPFSGVLFMSSTSQFVSLLYFAQLSAPLFCRIPCFCRTQIFTPTFFWDVATSFGANFPPLRRTSSVLLNLPLDNMGQVFSLKEMLRHRNGIISEFTRGGRLHFFRSAYGSANARCHPIRFANKKRRACVGEEFGKHGYKYYNPVFFPSAPEISPPPRGTPFWEFAFLGELTNAKGS